MVVSPTLIMSRSLVIQDIANTYMSQVMLEETITAEVALSKYLSGSPSKEKLTRLLSIQHSLPMDQEEEETSDSQSTSQFIQILKLILSGPSHQCIFNIMYAMLEDKCRVFSWVISQDGIMVLRLAPGNSQKSHAKVNGVTGQSVLILPFPTNNTVDMEQASEFTHTPTPTITRSARHQLVNIR